MDLSIIIVNWNSKEYLRKCINSILKTTKNITYEIVVIDNASLDGTGEMLHQDFPHILFIQNCKNDGFAAANNRAFELSQGRILLFLNPDTETQDESIQILFQHLESLPDAAIVGAKLINSDGTLQTSCIQSFPSIFNQLLDAEFFRQRFPRSPLWGMVPLFNNSTEPALVEAVSGACLMISRQVFERLGMFCHDYFMYSEDIDLCFKAKQAGLRTYYVPRAIVMHHGGSSTSKRGQNAFSTIMMLESRWQFLMTNRSRYYGFCYRLSVIFASLVRIAILLYNNLTMKFIGKVSLHAKSLAKWRASLRWALRREEWVHGHYAGNSSISELPARINKSSYD